MNTLTMWFISKKKPSFLVRVGKTCTDAIALYIDIERKREKLFFTKYYIHQTKFWLIKQKKSEELCYYHLMNNALYEFGTSSTEKKHYIYIYSSCIYMLGPIILPFFISIHCPMPCRKSNLVAMASRSIMCSAPNRAVSACLAWPA